MAKMKLHVGYVNSHGSAIAYDLGINFWSPTPFAETQLDKDETRKAKALGLNRRDSLKWAQENKS